MSRIQWSRSEVTRDHSRDQTSFPNSDSSVSKSTITSSWLTGRPGSPIHCSNRLVTTLLGFVCLIRKHSPNISVTHVIPPSLTLAAISLLIFTSPVHSSMSTPYVFSGSRYSSSSFSLAAQQLTPHQSPVGGCSFDNSSTTRIR